MSFVSKATFAATCITTISIITYVHYKQIYDREQLHLGVVRDQERQERRKRENLYILQRQVTLGEKLRNEENEREKQ